ncbi:drebrin-like protein B [Ananas comosus]|uniref:Drebrin-like protein B n=1 Tax=Ananas comosus TaxID=4615 RepID=A0A6P5EHY1_ANACO|nr:drebrin-like protein B [Ananas comosus]XP_020081035.1 drebrin-like protein B [Ananas comosus]
MGVVLRQYAPLNVNKWAEVPMHYKDKMWADLMEKYDGLAGFRDEVMYNFNHMYRDWRHRKHLHYNQFLTDEDRLKNCPDDITELDWACLVEYFGSESFKRMSARNKANRAKQSASSICGRKSFASVLYDMRDPITEVDPDLTEYWKATHQRRTDNTWCSDTAKNAMKQFEDVRNSQEELGDPPLSTEEHLTKAFGARSGYLRGLGCGPKPLSSKNLEAKASKEAIERQIEELKNELKQSRGGNEEREARLQKEKDEREERFKKEIEEIKAHFSKDEREERFKKQIEDIKAHFKAEFNEQLKIIVQLYGAPTTSSPPSTQNH